MKRAVTLCATLFLIANAGLGEDSVVPTRVIRPFNGSDLSGLTAWQKASETQATEKGYTAKDGMLHISGEGSGYIRTNQDYRNYHLKAEYKWGKKTDGSKYVRNSGILLHGTGKDGNARGVWMTSVEVQLAQGCEGDFIVIRGKDEAGETVPATITCDTRIAEDGKTRWQKGGKKTVYSGRQFWWNNHQPGFKELLDTRGTDDVASRLGEWTKVECICRDDRITVLINGVVVNECYDVFPASGKILFQNESNEVYFRNIELHPLPPDDAER